MMRPQFATPGEKLIKKGDRGDAAYFIASGAVEVQAPTHNVRLGRGDVFGEIALMTGGRRSADVFALGYCQLLYLKAHDFKALMEQHPDLRDHVVSLAQERQLMNIDEPEHDVEDPVFPVFTKDDPDTEPANDEQAPATEQPEPAGSEPEHADKVNAESSDTAPELTESSKAAAPEPANDATAAEEPAIEPSEEKITDAEGRSETSEPETSDQAIKKETASG